MIAAYVAAGYLAMIHHCEQACADLAMAISDKLFRLIDTYLLANPTNGAAISAYYLKLKGERQVP